MSLGVNTSVPDFPDLRALYATVTIIGLLMNCGLVILLCNFQLASRLTMILLRTQSVADAASCLFSLLTCLIRTAETGHYLKDMVTCHLWNSQLFYWTSVVMSTSNLIWVTVDRLWATVYAITYKRNFRRYLIVSSVISCCYITFLVIPVSLLVQYRNGTCIAMSLVTTNDAYYSNFVHPYLWLITYYFLPSFVMLCVHIRIILFMRRITGKKNTRESTEQQKEDKIMRPFTISTFGFAASLMAGHAYGTYYYVTETTNTLFYEPGAPKQLLSVFLTTLNCCINPIILLAAVPQLRGQIVKMCESFFRLCQKKCTRQGEQSKTQT